MKTISKKHFLENKTFYLDEISQWKVFIYPTDTILGIWCNIKHAHSIKKIFQLKSREKKPLLIIIPHLQWLEENCILSQGNKDYIEKKLPWAYSFILNLQETTTLDPQINNNSGTIWVRIPDNWFAKIIADSETPFITTSVNIAWEPSILNIKDIPENIASWVDYIIKDSANFSGKSSTLIDMRGKKRKVLRN